MYVRFIEIFLSNLEKCIEKLLKDEGSILTIYNSLLLHERTYCCTEKAQKGVLFFGGWKGAVASATFFN